MKCKYCNADIEKDAQFCTNCGKDLSKFERCVNCGELLDRDTVFCPYCGTEQSKKDEVNEQNEQKDSMQESKPEVVDDILQHDEEKSSKKWVWAVIAVILLAIIGGGVYFATNGGFGFKAMAEAVDSNSIAVVDPSDTIAIDTDIHSIDGIKERLNEILIQSQTMSDENTVNTFFSNEFKNLYKKVEEYDATLDGPGFWIGNLWDGGQDGNPDMFEIVGVSTSSSSLALAEVNCKYQKGEYKAENKINLVLAFENDNWVIDNIDGNKEQMKEYLTSSSVDSAPQTITNGMYSMAGKVSKYAIHMNIEINGSDVKGYYYYDSQGSGNKVKLSGSLKEGGELMLNKFSNDGEETGYFEGIFNGIEYSGKNVNYNRDEYLPFNVALE